MRQTKLVAMLLLALACLCSCKDSDSDADFNLSELYGYWTGTQSNANQRIYLTFNEDKTGEFTYESNVYYRVATFTYKVSGDEIICKGIIAGEDGVVNNWEQTFRWNGTYLSPIGAYQGIYIYKNGYHPDDDEDDYEPDIKVNFSIRHVHDYQNGTYLYFVDVAVTFPAGLRDKEISMAGVALDLINGTLGNSKDLEKIDIDGKTRPSLEYWVTNDNGAHTIMWEILVDSKDKFLKLDYLPFFYHKYGITSLGWKSVTLTPTNTTDGSGNDSGTSGAVQTYTIKGVSFKMVQVEGGTFQMGTKNGNSDEQPVHQVTLNSFSIGQTEVTQELWQAVMGSNPTDDTFGGKGNRKPVTTVNWNDCQAFISKLNQLTGKKFRMPTEAEWEYAARGGNMSKGFLYSGSNLIDDVAWYSGSSPHDVATKAPNELGIYDMSGNVWEFCQDRYSSSYYSESPVNNPLGPSSGSLRVIRGGGIRSLMNDITRYRVTIREYMIPTYTYGNLGLRLAQ